MRLQSLGLRHQVVIIVRSLITILAVALCHQAQAATATREVYIDADPAAVWDALRDVGAVDRRLVPGLVVSDHLEHGIRTLTFANGRVTKEAIITIDDLAHRIAYAQVGGPATHHNASMQVFASGNGSRLVWIADMLPDSLANQAAEYVEKVLSVAKATLERKQ